MTRYPSDERWHQERMRLLDERKRHFESQARIWSAAMWLCWGFLAALGLIVLVVVLAYVAAP